MPFTSTDLANVDAAIASGELSVEVEGKRLTYRSMADLLLARQMITDQLALDAPAVRPRRGTYSVRFATARGE